MMTATTGNKRRVATNALSMLPEEMEMEVLLRLPVKWIFRFNAVCRCWAVLLSSEEFCSSWAKITESRTTQPAAQLLFLSLPPRTYERRSTETEVCSGDGRRLLTINAVRDLYPGRDGIELAPCCGLVLLYDTLSLSGSYHVLNASTRAAAELPPPTPCQEGIASSAGLGFDARTKEHKVVQLFYRNDRPECEVLALGKGSERGWRPPTSFAANDGGVMPTALAMSALLTAGCHRMTPVFADGFLHWFFDPIWAKSLGATSMPAAVLSFSVADETFSSWVQPPPFDWDLAGRAHLTELDGRLCIVRDLRHGPGLLEIWSYGGAAGGGSCWSLKHRIDLVEQQHAAGRDDLVKPSFARVLGGSFGKGKVIFIASVRCKVLAYDPISRTLETILQFAEERSPLYYTRGSLTMSLCLKRALLQCIRQTK